MIRPAAVDDAAAIASIQARGWRHAYADIVAPQDMPAPGEKEPLWREWLMREDVDAVVWDQGGMVAGFAFAGRARDGSGDGELYAIYVDPAAQGAGVGASLLAAAVDGLRARGFARALLWTFQDNGLARAFYERHGWTLDHGAVAHVPPEVRYRRGL